MDWLRDALSALQDGRSALVHPGDFFLPTALEVERFVVVDPVRPEDISIDDVLLVRWKSEPILRVAKWVEADRLLVANRSGHINGWIYRRDVLGRLNMDKSDAWSAEMASQPSTLVLCVQVIEESAKGGTVGHLACHSERYSSHAGCPTHEPRFRTRLIAAAHEAFLYARDAPWSNDS